MASAFFQCIKKKVFAKREKLPKRRLLLLRHEYVWVCVCVSVYQLCV